MVSEHFFDFFFPQNGIVHILIPFIIDKVVTVVLSGKSAGFSPVRVVLCEARLSASDM